MIEYTTPPIPANPPGEAVELTREQLWQGLVWKAEFPTLFVAPISRCTILDTFDDGILREIVHLTTAGRPPEVLQERVFYEPTARMTFLRLNGAVTGQMVNLIEGDESPGLRLRFEFTLALVGAEPGGTEEADYLEGFSKGYLAAVSATLAAIRGFVAGGEDPTTELARERAAAATPRPG